MMDRVAAYGGTPGSLRAEAHGMSSLQVKGVLSASKVLPGFLPQHTPSADSRLFLRRKSLQTGKTRVMERIKELCLPPEHFNGFRALDLRQADDVEFFKR